MKTEPSKKKLYGLLAEFKSADALLKAARKVKEAGYRKTDAFSPFPIHGLSDALGMHKTRLPTLVLVGGLLGCIGGFLFQYWVSVIDFPYNVGGKPFNSWPAFIPVTFELTILGAALAAVLGMLGLNGLPMPYHPLFNVERFAMASRDRFFLCIEAKDPQFEIERTMKFLDLLEPVEIHPVPSS